MTTVLELCQSAADELSLVRPNDLVTATDDNTAQKLLRHLTRSCRQLAAGYDWQVLRREHTFATVASAAQTGAIPTDFLRFVPDTMWNRTTRTKVLGPIDPSDWQARQAVLVNGPFQNFVIRGSSLLLTPVPGADWDIYYEYISKNIGTDVDGTNERSAFEADDDIAIFDDEMLILGIVWRYRKAEGLDYSEEYREFQMRRADMIKMDGNRRLIDMNGDKLDRPVNTTYTEIAELVTI